MIQRVQLRAVDAPCEGVVGRGEEEVELVGVEPADDLGCGRWVVGRWYESGVEGGVSGFACEGDTGVGMERECVCVCV